LRWYMAGSCGERGLLGAGGGGGSVDARLWEMPPPVSGGPDLQV
jgi:hypothetical protein